MFKDEYKRQWARVRHMVVRVVEVADQDEQKSAIFEIYAIPPMATSFSPVSSEV